MIRKLLAFWQRLRRRDQFERDLRAELAFHQQCRIEALQREGLSLAQAQRQAKLELGMVETHKDAVRAAFGLAFIDQLSLALKRALKALQRYRSLAVSATLILSLAMALNLSVYGIYRSYLSNIPEVMRTQPAFDLSVRNQKGELVTRLNDDEFALLKDALSTMAEFVISTKQVRMAIAGSSIQAGELSSAYGMSVSGSYFADISHGSAISPRLGRWLNEEDDRPGAASVIVLSDSGWRRLTGADPAILGKSIRFAKTSFTVVGVMPPEFIDLQPFPSHFWLSHSGYRQWRAGYTGSDVNEVQDLTFIGVVDPERAIGELSGLLANLPNRAGDDRIARVDLLPRRGLFPAADAEDLELAAMPILLLTLVVLLVACANLANLTLAKALGQRQEFAVHESLGASRWRIVLQLSLECALLALGCAFIATVLSVALADVLQQYAFSGLEEMGVTPFPTRFDGAVVLFALFLAAVATLLVGAIPAWIATRSTRNLRQSAGGVGQVLSPSRLRGSLSILQIAASFILLFLTALATQIAFSSRNVELGYAQSRLLDLRASQLSSTLRNQIEQMPGVVSTTAVASTPLYGWQPQRQFRVDSVLLNAGSNRVDERFVSTLGIKLLQGRNFSSAEAQANAPLALVSAATARLFWPNASPLDQVITEVGEDESVRNYTVIGVLDDVVSGLTFQGKDRAMVYFPGALNTQAQGMRELIIAVVPERRAELSRELSALCVRANADQMCEPWSFDRLVERQQFPFAIAKNLALALALTALAICVFGLFGMVKFNVSNRRREMSLRLAIGAPPEGLVRLMLAEVLRHLSWGCCIAGPVCVLVWVVIHDSFRIGAISALAQMLIASTVLFIAALMAARIPASNAMSISPMESLRQL